MHAFVFSYFSPLCLFLYTATSLHLKGIAFCKRWDLLFNYVIALGCLSILCDWPYSQFFVWLPVDECVPKHAIVTNQRIWELQFRSTGSQKLSFYSVQICIVLWDHKGKSHRPSELGDLKMSSEGQLQKLGCQIKVQVPWWNANLEWGRRKWWRWCLPP